MSIPVTTSDLAARLEEYGAACFLVSVGADSAGCNFAKVVHVPVTWDGEVRRCTREKIRINVFVLDATPHLARFVEDMTRLNGGRAFFTTNENLGDYVLVDFVEQRRVAR